MSGQVEPTFGSVVVVVTVVVDVVVGVVVVGMVVVVVVVVVGTNISAEVIVTEGTTICCTVA